MAEYSDKELLELYRKGDNKNYAFNLIVRAYQERLYWLIRRTLQNHEDANDALQNTFVKAWKGLPKFREESKLYSWLYRIAVNESLTIAAKNSKRRQEPIEEHHHSGSSNNEDPTSEEIQLKLEKAIATLPDKQRVVFHLKYFEEKKYDEMAEILDTSVGALKASYHHAVKKIEHFLVSN